MEYEDQKVPSDIETIFNVCWSDIINNFRCSYCNSDSIKLEAYFKAPIGSTHEEKREILKNLVLAHYDPEKKKFMPSEDLTPLCIIHAKKRNIEIKARMADYYTFMGDEVLE